MVSKGSGKHLGFWAITVWLSFVELPYSYFKTISGDPSPVGSVIALVLLGSNMKKLLSMLLLLVLISCAGGKHTYNQIHVLGIEATAENRLTYGSIKKHMKVNKTTQADVLLEFGSPNNMTITSKGTELWIYDKIRTEIGGATNGSRSGGYVGLGVVGAGGGSSSSYTTSIQSTKTLTVILEFNKDNVLIDYSARTGRY